MTTPTRTSLLPLLFAFAGLVSLSGCLVKTGSGPGHSHHESRADEKHPDYHCHNRGSHKRPVKCHVHPKKSGHDSEPL